MEDVMENNKIDFNSFAEKSLRAGAVVPNSNSIALQNVFRVFWFPQKKVLLSSSITVSSVKLPIPCNLISLINIFPPMINFHFDVDFFVNFLSI